MVVRLWLVSLGVALACSAPLAWAGASPLTLHEKVLHVLNRMSFGPRPGEVNRLFKSGPTGLKRWMETQLHPEKIDDRALGNKLALLPMESMDTLELLHRYKDLNQILRASGKNKLKDMNQEERREFRQANKGRLVGQILEQMQSERLIRAVESRRQLQEVLFDFWANHFNVDWSKGAVRWLAPDFEKNAVRAHMFSTFLDLLRATAHSPAMLVYLDNQVSRATPPHFHPHGKQLRPPGINENYARELMELHTLGVDGGYTQADVIALARILTGWSVKNVRNDPVFVFRPQWHDRGEKVFLGRRFPAGRGMDEGEEALRMLANSPATARFISTELAKYFVSENPPPSLIRRMVKTFRSTHGDLRALYTAMFFSPEFWSRASYTAKVKRPLQFVVASIRALGGELDLQTALPKVLATMGEEPYRCQPPTGYKDDAETWINPGALINRMDFALKLSVNRINGVFVRLPNITPSNQPGKIVEAVSVDLLGRPLTKASTKVVLGQFGGESPLFADDELRPISLAKAVGLILGSPEFQRR